MYAHTVVYAHILNLILMNELYVQVNVCSVISTCVFLKVAHQPNSNRKQGSQGSSKRLVEEGNNKAPGKPLTRHRWKEESEIGKRQQAFLLCMAHCFEFAFYCSASTGADNSAESFHQGWLIMQWFPVLRHRRITCSQRRHTHGRATYTGQTQLSWALLRGMVLKISWSVSGDAHSTYASPYNLILLPWSPLPSCHAFMAFCRRCSVMFVMHFY